MMNTISEPPNAQLEDAVKGDRFNPCFLLIPGLPAGSSSISTRNKMQVLF